jgi:GT2 family glycosyltransferase
MLVHIDRSDGSLASLIAAEFPEVHVFESDIRRGPGGGRDVLLRHCSQPFVASFDDDSYPVDHDFFATVVERFADDAQAAVVSANLWNRGEPERERVRNTMRAATFLGGGHAIRVDAYLGIRGYLPRPVAYGMEEKDVALQLYAKGWHVVYAMDLRVYHDSSLTNHQSPETVAGTIANFALFPFIHYPLWAIPRALLQFANGLFYQVKRGRLRGILKGLASIPLDCWSHRGLRAPVDLETLKKFMKLRSDGIL